MNIMLKKADLPELTRIHAIQVRSFGDLLDKYRDYGTNPGAEGMDAISRRFHQPDTAYYFICLDDQQIGMMRICDRGTRCRISPICILPEFRGLGAGKKAMQLAEKAYPAAAVWELDTILQEKPLCKFYENLGYRDTGKREHLRDGMDLIFYEKNL